MTFVCDHSAMLNDGAPSSGPAAATADLRLSPIQRSPARARASDWVFGELRSAIRDLRLAPGTWISEIDLTSMLQVSRTPVREAIARLADVGLVQVVPQVGTRVALISLSAVEQARFVREAVELAAFETACSLPVRDVHALRDLLVTQRQAQQDDDIDAFFVADEAFHQQIFTLAGYPDVWEGIQQMKIQLDRLRRLSLPDPANLENLIREHQLIVEALEAGDVAEGRNRVSAHARRIRDDAPGVKSARPGYFSP